MACAFGVGDEGVAVLEPRCCHPAHDGVLLARETGRGVDVIGDLIDVAPHLGKGREDLAPVIDQLAAPLDGGNELGAVGAIVAAQARDIGIEAELATEDAVTDDVIIIDDRMSARFGVRGVIRQKAAEMIEVGAEVVAPVDALKISERDAVRAQDTVELIEAAEGVVAFERHIPARLPPRAEAEPPLGLEAAAPGVLKGALEKYTRVEQRRLIAVVLKDASQLDLVGAVGQPMAPFALPEHPLFAHESGREGEIHVGGDLPVVGDLHPGAEILGLADLGNEQARAPFDRGVGMEKEGHPGHWHTEKLERGVLVVNVALAALVNDLGRLDLPDGGPFGVLAAGLAGREDGALENRGLAVLACRQRRCNAHILFRDDAQRADEAVAKVVSECNALGIDDGAVGLLDADIALRLERIGGLVVDDAVGKQRVVVVVDLDIAARDHAIAAVVVDELVRLQEHRFGAVDGQLLAEDGGRLRLGVGRLRVCGGCEQGGESKRRTDGQQCQGRSASFGAGAHERPEARKCLRGRQSPDAHKVRRAPLNVDVSCH